LRLPPTNLSGRLPALGVGATGFGRASLGAHLLSRDFPRPEALLDLVRTPQVPIKIKQNTATV